MTVQTTDSTTERTPAERRLIESFEEINQFFEDNNREPKVGADIGEFMLASRLQGIRNNPKAIFAPIKKKYYDKYFEYRMMYNLRIYMTHCEMAVTQVQLKFDEGEMFIYIEPSKLLENTGRLQKVFIPELQQMYDDGKRIDLYELMEEFEKMFSLMHKELLKGIEPRYGTVCLGGISHGSLRR